MSRIQVTAEVYVDEILCEMSCDELAQELLDRLESTSKTRRKDAAKAVAKLGFAQPTPDDWTDTLDEIEQSVARGDRMHFAVLLHRLRVALIPWHPPAVLAAMAQAEKRP